MGHSVIDMPSEDRYITLRASYVAICDGNHCAAALLGLIENWTNYALRRRQQIAAENKARAAGDLPPDASDPTWVYRTYDELAEDMFGTFPRSAFGDAIRILTDKGYVKSRTNPTYPWDRSKQYQLQVEAVRAAVGSWASTVRQSCIDSTANIEGAILTPSLKLINYREMISPKGDFAYSAPSTFEEAVELFHQATGSLMNPLVAEEARDLFDDLERDDHRDWWVLALQAAQGKASPWAYLRQTLANAIRTRTPPGVRPGLQTKRQPLDDPGAMTLVNVAAAAGVELELNGIQVAAIAAVVEDIEKWAEVIKAWALKGYRWDNVAGMLDWYKNGVPSSGNGLGARRNGSNSNGKSLTQTSYTDSNWQFTAEERADLAALAAQRTAGRASA